MTKAASLKPLSVCTRSQAVIPSLPYMVRGSGNQSSFSKAVKSTSELWQVLGRSGEHLRIPLKIRRPSCVRYTGRGAKVWICCAMRSIVPKGGRLSQRLCCSASRFTTSRNKSKLSISNLEKSHCSRSGNPLPWWAWLGSRQYLKCREICVAWISAGTRRGAGTTFLFVQESMHGR